MDGVCSGASEEIQFDGWGLDVVFVIYLTGYCKGNYEPNATALNPTKENIGCSNHAILFHFQLTKMINDHLPSGITLEDLHWPTGIEDMERALTTMGVAMSIVYITGVVSTATAVFISLWTLCFNGQLSKYFKSGILLVGFNPVLSFPCPKHYHILARI